MPISGTVLLIAAAAASAASAIAQAQAASQQAEFQATVSTQKAGREREIAAAEERDFRRKQSRTFAARRAALGASGVEGGTGSPLIGAADFAAETELQALRIRAGGATQATRLEQQATLLRAGGRAARTRGTLRAGASLLSGFGQAFR